MANLLAYMNDRAGVPTLVRAGVAHAQFESIHPFLDGNGRLGRLLITLLLHQRGELRRPLLYLSAFLKENRAEYYDSLMHIRLRGEWEGWLRFFLAGVAAAASEGFSSAVRARDILAHDARQVDTRLSRKAYTRPLLDLLARYPRVPARFVEAQLGCSPATANATLQDLRQLGILEEETGKERDRVYVYQRYLDALSPPGSA
jgi:Fic family protein